MSRMPPNKKHRASDDEDTDKKDSTQYQDTSSAGATTVSAPAPPTPVATTATAVPAVASCTSPSSICVGARASSATRHHHCSNKNCATPRAHHHHHHHPRASNHNSSINSTSKRTSQPHNKMHHQPPTTSSNPNGHQPPAVTTNSTNGTSGNCASSASSTNHAQPQMQTQGTPNGRSSNAAAHRHHHGTQRHPRYPNHPQQRTSTSTAGSSRTATGLTATADLPRQDSMSSTSSVLTPRSSPWSPSSSGSSSSSSGSSGSCSPPVASPPYPQYSSSGSGNPSGNESAPHVDEQRGEHGQRVQAQGYEQVQSLDQDQDQEDKEEDSSLPSLAQIENEIGNLTDESFTAWLLKQKELGISAGKMLDLLGLGVSDDVEVDETELWEAIISMGIRLIQPGIPARQKLPHVNTLEDVVALLEKANKIVVLAGAGISVSCGIPDFRSENGIYSRLGEYDLPNPQCMFDIDFFRSNPRPFFAFAKELFPKAKGFTFVPSRSHYFLKLLQDKGKLLRIYSQNIDMLEHAAGISHERSVLCHGSFATATCLACRKTYPNDAIRDDVSKQRVPMCQNCNSPEGIIKPDIVFFGESLPRRFHDSIKSDENEADLVLVMGSSLKVNPVRSLVGRIRKDAPMILINREPVGRPHKFDVELLGYSDEIVQELCRRLNWTIPLPDADLLQHSNLGQDASMVLQQLALSQREPQTLAFEFIPPSRHMFNGARTTCYSSEDDDDFSSSGSSSNEEMEEETQDAQQIEQQQALQRPSSLDAPLATSHRGNAGMLDTERDDVESCSSSSGVFMEQQAVEEALRLENNFERPRPALATPTMTPTAMAHSHPCSEVFCTNTIIENDL